MKFGWPHIMAAIEERQQKIAEGLAAADRSKKDLAQAEEKVNEVLREARGKANEIIAQAEARANADRRRRQGTKRSPKATARRRPPRPRSSPPPTVPAKTCASRCPRWPSPVPKS